MTRHILFRFHRAYDVCLQNLIALKKLNPGCKIHGMYGGNDTLKSLPKELVREFTSLWRIPFDDRHYKWMNGDLCVRWWYKEKGN